MTRTIKLVIIGDSGVGKTSLRNQYISGRFSTGYRATIGTDFIAKTLPHHSNPDESVTLQIWDTAGQERFSSLSSAFFRGADAALLMFDVNRPETLDGLAKWWDEFKARAPVPDEEAEDYCCVVVGNKVDLADATVSSSSGSSDDEATVRGAGLPRPRRRVTEVEAEAFLEDLVPRTSRGSPSLDVPDDPFDDSWPVANGRGDGHANSTTDPGPSSSLGPDAAPLSASTPLATRSIDIAHGAGVRHPYAPRRTKYLSKSRSSERSALGGTMRSTRTGMTIYHTPSSSLFDSYESAPTSPVASVVHLPQSLTHGNGTAEHPMELPVGRRLTNASTSRSSSAPTITPSVFTRTRATPTDTTTLGTPPEHLQHSQSSHSLAQLQTAPPLPPPPERRPKLFLTSAKTGTGVAPVFEYIARRVMMQWEYEEAREARTTHLREDTGTSIRLGDLDRRRGLALWRERMSGGCCGV